MAFGFLFLPWRYQDLTKTLLPPQEHCHLIPLTPAPPPLLQLYYLRLPKDIKDYHIFLMDATVATGAAGIMAIRVLLDHDVPEDHISLCSLLMTEQGEHSHACIC